MIAGSAENFPQACIALCILQMLLAVIPDRNRALTISLYTMTITLSNSLMPLLGVRIFNAFGGETAAFYLFNSIVFCWRLLSTSLFVFRYFLFRKKPDLFLMPEEEKHALS